MNLAAIRADHTFAANAPQHPCNPTLDLELLRTLVPVRRIQVKAGQVLYRAGSAFDSIYVVHAGCFKTQLVSADGRERTTGFRMRGDLLGADSIGSPVRMSDAVALDDGEVRELPYPAVMRACAGVPELQAMLTVALAAEIRTDRQWMLALGTLTAEQRVAAFLLDLGARHAALGYSGQHFVMRMTRAEIGSFLSIKLETVTRCMTLLAGRGCIEVRRREIRLVDHAALEALASGAGLRMH
ncbi:MAG TPA: helix-turn-helix domain-containing protein [Xanthomonadales bacterium]|nr:helix-turn-helix domain-containing protein [Xanthomonadales bacterium]